MRTGLAMVLLAACSGGGSEQTGETGDTDTVVDPGTTSTGPERVQTILGLETDTAAGEATYTNICSACHLAEGTGGVQGSADLTARIPEMTDDEVVTTVLEGIGNMDSYRFLKNQEIADVVAYAISSFGP